MTKSLVSVLALVLPALLVTTPSYATKGIDAARICEKTPRCHVEYYDDGSIIIVTTNGDTISCPGPQQDCTVLIRPALKLNPNLNRPKAPATLAN